MREITFRGKRLDNGEWVMSQNIIRFNEDNQVFIAKKDDKNISIFDLHGNILQIEEGTFYKVGPATVGQFTGVKDRNGRKVFENDILSVFDVDEKHGVTEFVGKVFMDGGCWLVSQSKTCDWYLHDLQDGCHSLIEIEVIGNIHDNPELMGGADNDK